MAKVEQPLFVLPIKRNGKKANSNASHVDHIITVQGDDAQVKYKNGLSPVTENESGTVQSSIENLKSSMKINLCYNDINNKNDNCDDSGKVHIEKNGSQALSTNFGREIIDLSPIYENSSDACSSHGDCFENEEMQKSCIVLNEINVSATLNSFSQTPSEVSCEIGNPSDSLKSAKKKNVNIVPELHDNTDSEITTIKVDSECGSINGDYSLAPDTKDLHSTMIGTIKHGKNKGKQLKIKINISCEELEILEAKMIAEKHDKINISKCSLHKGLHIFIFSMMCLPFVTLISAAYSFYIGTQAWYNICLTFSDTFTWKTVILLPLIMILYPFMIVIFSVGIGLNAGFVQLSFSDLTWWVTVRDLEKGFYGSFCNAIGLSECCPYEIVLLLDVK